MTAHGGLAPVRHVLRLAGRELGRERPAVMAIINRTDDSFYPDARHPSLDDAVRAGAEAVAAGAEILDVGGVRAGRGPKVSVSAEIERVVPLIERLRAEVGEAACLSVDTWRAEVASAAIDAGAVLVNDTWAGFDPNVARVAGAKGAGLVCSHTGGMTPRTDPFRPAYPSGADGEGVVAAVAGKLALAASDAIDAGVSPDAIVLDPTLDFGKTTWHSLTLVRRTDQFTQLGYPVLLAASRKDFVGEMLDVPVSERLAGSLAAAAIAAWLGVSVVRTHDVAATKQALEMVAGIRGDLPPAAALRGLA